MRKILPLVPNIRRIAVVSAFIGMREQELRQLVGAHRVVRDVEPSTWMARAWRMAEVFDMKVTEFWEIDDDFNPKDVFRNPRNYGHGGARMGAGRRRPDVPNRNTGTDSGQSNQRVFRGKSAA